MSINSLKEKENQLNKIFGVKKGKTIVTNNIAAYENTK
jgi:hypothetical protein